MKRVRQCLLVFILCLPAIAQQTDINRYTLFTGFDYMVSPARNLTERGFETDFGITARPWLGLGGDFSIITGAGTINGSETVFAPLLIAAEPLGAPPPNTVNVAFTSTTYIFAAGPQFYWRKWKKVTLFARPGFGGIHETADISLPPQLGFLLTQLGVPAPNSHQTDLTWFIGVGGGFDLNVSRRVGIRFTTDWVNTHLFSDLLTPRQNYVRFGIGPTFRWGELKR